MFHHARVLPRSPSAAISRLQRRQISDVLPLIASAKSLSQTHQSHALAVVHGHLPRSVSIAAALILSYATHNSQFNTLKILFKQTLTFSLSPFLHNTLIRACTILSNGSQKGCSDWKNYGFSLYNELLKGEVPVRPDDYTFPFVLKICADFSVVRKGLEVHGSLIKIGFDFDVFVNNTLILFYGSLGDLMSVEKVFNEMPERDLVSWNSVIRVFSDHDRGLQSVSLFRSMISISGFMPNLISVVSVLPVLVVIGDELLVGLIHCYVVKVGLDNELRVGNVLVDAYGKCGNFECLERVFDSMVERNEVSWNSIIGSFAHRGFNANALRNFRLMVNEGLKLNSITLATILPSLVELNLFDKGREVHGFSMKMGFDSDTFVANSLMDMYGKCSRLAEASNVFKKLGVKNVVSWNTMIATFSQNGLELDAFAHVKAMQDNGHIVNSFTLTNVLPACARLGSLLHGKEIHARSIRFQSSLELFVSNALTDMYSKCGSLNLAQKVFDISYRDEVSYNILITGYSQTNECSNSITLFQEMEKLNLNLDSISYMGVLSACANLSAIKEGKQIHAFAIRRLFHEHVFVANSFLDMYTKCGKINISKKIFKKIPNKDTASWNTIILGYGMLGELHTAIQFFEEMKIDRVEPDSVSYIAVLSACSHGGLLEKGRLYFDQMLTNKIEPSEMHYACMVDLLGRAGLMEEAVLLINGLKVEPGVNIWGALLGSSRVHGNVDIGCWAAEKLLELRPENSGYYVLLSNLYAEAGKWAEADKVRSLMSKKKVKKNPGCSWVRVEDRVHGFVSGERFDPCKVGHG